MFTRMLRHARPAPERFTELAGDLFEVMATGGRVGFETVAWFNGGLFDDSTVLPLEKSDIDMVLAASDLDWSEILAHGCSTTRATSTSKSTTPTPTATPRSTSPPSSWLACGSAPESAASTASASTAPTRPATTASSSRVLQRGRRAVNTSASSPSSGTTSASSTRRSPPGTPPRPAALQRLNRFRPRNRFYAANRELGRALKTEFVLQYMSEPKLRAKVRRGLLKVEQLHALARAVYYGQRGRISAREVYDQMNACSCLTLILACIVYWQAREISRLAAAPDFPFRPRPAAACQPDRVEERHPLRRDQDRPRQAQDATPDERDREARPANSTPIRVASPTMSSPRARSSATRFVPRIRGPAVEAAVRVSNAPVSRSNSGHWSAAR